MPCIQMRHFRELIAYGSLFSSQNGQAIKRSSGHNSCFEYTTAVKLFLGVVQADAGGVKPAFCVISNELFPELTTITMFSKQAVKWIALASFVAAGSAVFAAEDKVELVLTNIEQIRALAPREIARSPAVRLEAVVTLYTPSLFYLWVQDEFDGVSLLLRNRRFAVEPAIMCGSSAGLFRLRIRLLWSPKRLSFWEKTNCLNR